MLGEEHRLWASYCQRLGIAILSSIAGVGGLDFKRHTKGNVSAFAGAGWRLQCLVDVGAIVGEC